MDVTLYAYLKWDIQTGSYVIPPRMATREYIERIDGQILEESAKTVDESSVNEEQEILDPAKGR